MASTRYNELQRCAQRLREALLPSKFDATGNYRSPERVHLRALSFRILIHAELESFIEDRAMELFDVAWQAWIQDHVPSQVVVALLAFSGVSTQVPPGRLGHDPANQKAYNDLREPVQKAQAVWRAAHKDNHGVKEANVLALLLPLGIAPNDLDPTFLADLTSYGSDRGAAAHSSSVKVKRATDPRVELERAQQLIKDTAKLDEVIDAGIDSVSRLRKAMAVKAKARGADSTKPTAPPPPAPAPPAR